MSQAVGRRYYNLKQGRLHDPPTGYCRSSRDRTAQATKASEALTHQRLSLISCYSSATKNTYNWDGMVTRSGSRCGRRRWYAVHPPHLFYTDTKCPRAHLIEIVATSPSLNGRSFSEYPSTAAHSSHLRDAVVSSSISSLRLRVTRRYIERAWWATLCLARRCFFFTLSCKSAFRGQLADAERRIYATSRSISTSGLRGSTSAGAVRDHVLAVGVQVIEIQVNTDRNI